MSIQDFPRSEDGATAPKTPTPPGGEAPPARVAAATQPASPDLDVVATRLAELVDLIRLTKAPVAAAPVPGPAPFPEPAPPAAVEPAKSDAPSPEPAPVTPEATNIKVDADNIAELMARHLGAAPVKADIAPRPAPPATVAAETPASAPRRAEPPFTTNAFRRPPRPRQEGLPPPLPGFSTRQPVQLRAIDAPPKAAPAPVVPEPQRPSPAEAANRDFYGAVEALRRLTVDRAGRANGPANEPPPPAIPVDKQPAASNPPAEPPTPPAAKAATDDTLAPAPGRRLVVAPPEAAPRAPDTVAPQARVAAPPSEAGDEDLTDIKPVSGESFWPPRFGSFAAKRADFARSRSTPPIGDKKPAPAAKPAPPAVVARQSLLATAPSKPASSDAPVSLFTPGRAAAAIAAGVAVLAIGAMAFSPQRGDAGQMAAMMQELRTKLGVLDRLASRDEVAAVRENVGELRSGLQDLGSSTNAAIAELRARLDRVDRTPVASLGGQTNVPMERPQPQTRPAVTTLTAPAGLTSQTFTLPTPIYISPGKPPPVTTNQTTRGYIVREVYHNGSAVLENAAGRQRVSVGDTVPGLGKVQAIEMRGRKWVVVTAAGLIDAGVN